MRLLPIEIDQVDSEGGLDLLFESIAFGWEQYGWSQLEARGKWVLNEIERSGDYELRRWARHEVLNGGT